MPAMDTDEPYSLVGRTQTGEFNIYVGTGCMINELVDILVSYGVSVRYNDGMVYTRKDIGEDALVFDILKFNDTFLVRIFSEDCAGDLTEIWEHDVPRSDEKQVYEIVEKMKKVFEEFENHILENGSVNKPVLFENILNIIN